MPLSLSPDVSRVDLVIAARDYDKAFEYLARPWSPDVDGFFGTALDLAMRSIYNLALLHRGPIRYAARQSNGALLVTMEAH